MKKVVALFVCAVVLLGLVGCGAKAKKFEGIPCFPHSETLKLDAGKEAIIESEKLIIDEDYSGESVRYEPKGKNDSVFVDGQEFAVSYFLDEAEGGYAIYTDKNLNTELNDQYNALKKYFSNLYGTEGEESTENPYPKYVSDFKRTTWTFQIEDGVPYQVSVQISRHIEGNRDSLQLHAGVAQK